MIHSTDRASANGRLRVRVDCCDRTAREVLLEILPPCMQARDRGERAEVTVENLELLADSVTRLLKAFDHLAAELGATIDLADASGITNAFCEALSGRAHVDPVRRAGR